MLSRKAALPSMLAIGVLLASALAASQGWLDSGGPRPQRVTGTVRLEGQTIHRGALVEAVEAGQDVVEASTFTNDSGEFALSPAPGEYTLRVSLPAFLTAVRAPFTSSQVEILEFDEIVLTGGDVVGDQRLDVLDLATTARDLGQTESPWTAGFTTFPSLAWEQLPAVGPSPAPRTGATLVYDDTDNALLLFGGRHNQDLNDLWSFGLESGRWTDISAPGGPSPRNGHVAVFDSTRRQMVVFSAQSTGEFFNDVWVFDTVDRQWLELTPAGDRPVQRYGFCAGYDPEGDLFYIAHGFTSSAPFADTWAFDLEARIWSDVSPGAPGPVERCLHQCAFDTANGSLLLFGGQTGGLGSPSRTLNDLWRYDLSLETWTEIGLEGERPAERLFTSFVSDPGSRRFLLFGGGTTAGPLNDLWSYGPDDRWTEVETSGTTPEARENHDGVFVPDSGSLYIFGGAGSGGKLADLWRLRAGTGLFQ